MGKRIRTHTGDRVMRWRSSELLAWALDNVGINRATPNRVSVDTLLAKQLERSIARNSRMVSRLTALLNRLPAADNSNLRRDISRIISDRDPE